MGNLFYDTLKGKYGERPPVWYMRQAGRVLPNYNKLRESFSFSELMTNPELAARITLMPVADIGVDAAILFSDILTIPTALGMELQWSDHGPVFTNPIYKDLSSIQTFKFDPSKLSHVYKTLDIATKGETPVIGFCGAPFTTLCYMTQGTSQKHDFPETKKFIYTEKKKTEYLIELITEANIEYAKEQIKHGISAFQLFDTHAGLLPLSVYKELFLPSIKKISEAVRSAGIPFIFFPKGISSGLSFITPDICDFVSIDWQTPLLEARRMVHDEVGLQGNIDPFLLFASKETIAEIMSKEYAPMFSKYPKWIINLGHGVAPTTPIENLIFLTEWIKNPNNWK